MDAQTILPVGQDSRFEREMVEGPISLSTLLEQLIGFVRRQLRIFLLLFACSVTIGFVYLLTTPPKYTAHSRLLIDSSQLRILQQPQTPVGDVPIETAQVESQVELLNSDTVAMAVLKNLHLTEDPEFIGKKSGWLGNWSAPEQSSDLLTAQKALAAFLRNRDVTRVGRTYVLDIAFTSLSPSRAAAIANAIGEAYIDDQLEAKYQATRRAGAWLQDRIKDLRAQAAAADRAVLEYKEKNKIVDVVGGGGESTSRLIGEQQLSDLNTQLGAARAAAAEAQAKLERIDEIMKHDVADAAVSDFLKSDVITKLRNEIYDLNSRKSIWSARYGPNHIAVVNLRTQIDEAKHSILEELGRIAQSYKSDNEIAKRRVETLEKTLANLVSDSQSTNRDRLGLRELESAAQSYHSIYDSFLQHYMEAIQQQSFPITEARVISLAAIPSQKSGPRISKTLGVASAIGLIMGFGIALVREAADRVFRTTRQVENVIRTSCLAVLPLLKVASRPSAETTLKHNDFKMVFGLSAPTTFQAPLQKIVDLVATAGPSRTKIGPLNKARRDKLGAGGKKHGFMRYVVDEPLSEFAEAFRGIKVAVDIGGSFRTNKVIGVTSTLPREGKSTVSSNLAQSIAHAGKSVILIDGDLRNPTLTRSLAPHAKEGLIEMLANKIELRNAIYIDDRTKNFAFLPVVLKSRAAYANEILASDPFKQFIESLRKTYDYIIIDFPPIAPVADVRASAQVVDSFIFVVEWGKTRVNLVRHQLAAVPELSERLLGVVLNKTNIKMLERYEGDFGGYRYSSYYSTGD